MWYCFEKAVINLHSTCIIASHRRFHRMKKISAAYFSLPLFLILALSLLTACGESNNGAASTNAGPITVHLGYFPNITHAVALVGVAKGTFEQDFGKNVMLDTKQFNAGPSLIEALFAG